MKIKTPKKKQKDMICKRRNPGFPVRDDGAEQDSSHLYICSLIPQYLLKQIV